MKASIVYECPACSCTEQLPPGTYKNCSRCLDEIDEQHVLWPQAKLENKLDEIRARKGK